ncbi:MAG: hypothetical protein Q9M37_09135 [Desulfonauticus sp.]|nr:hypothetical protein [Desulfonauticus sp.]
MINLGLVNSLSVLPDPTLHLVFEKTSTYPETLLEIAQQGQTYLHLKLNPEYEFAPLFFSTIQGLKVKYTCLEPTSLVPIYNLSFSDALLKWGQEVWPAFLSWDGVFFFFTKNTNALLEEVFPKWIEKFTHVCFKSKYDLRVTEQTTKPKTSARRFFWQAKMLRAKG